MLDFVFAVIAAGLNSGGPEAATAAPVAEAPAEIAGPTTGAAPAGTQSVTMGAGVTVGAGVSVGGGLLAGTADQLAGAPATDGTREAPAAQGDQTFNMAVVPTGLQAEPQTPTGKFTTAVEVKPILAATKDNWIAVRAFDGKDLLYATHVWSWRCGLHAMAISVNGEAMQNWPMPPCHDTYATPNALLQDDALPFLSLRLGSVETIDVQIVYDDMTMDRAQYRRGDVLIP